MLLHRQVRPTSVPLTLAALLTGLGLTACEGAKFETDGSTATVGTDSGSSASASSDSTEQPALPPNTPPVEPIFGGPPPDDSEEQTSVPPVNTSGDEPSEDFTVDGDATAPAGSTDGAGDESTAAPGDTGTDGEVPEGEHCAAVADWDPAWSQWEDDVLRIVNEVRALGADCGSEGEFGPTTPLAMDPVLRCSSRLHSLDMFERDYFDHTNPDGLDPFDRMEEAGFAGSYMGENIAYGQRTPEEVMQAWVESDGHCSNIMSPNYTLLGVGYYPGADSRRDGNQHFWTQNFGAPQREGGFGGGGGGGFGR